MRVDLPAPFWPTRAWTSPGMTWIETPSSAMVAPKRFLMLRISRRGMGRREDGTVFDIRKGPDEFPGPQINQVPCVLSDGRLKAEL